MVELKKKMITQLMVVFFSDLILSSKSTLYYYYRTIRTNQEIQYLYGEATINGVLKISRLSLTGHV